MIPTALQVGEPGCGAPSDTPNERQVGRNAPNPYPDVGGSDASNEGECQGTIAERLLEATPERPFDDYQPDDPQYAILPEEYRCECPRPGNTPTFTKIRQLRRESGRTQPLGPPEFSANWR